MTSQTRTVTPITLAQKNSPSSQPPAWVNRAIAAGLQRLTVLSLEGTPARDVISLTAAVWGQTLGNGKVWVERRDAPRFEVAFETLCRTCRRWPAPADFLAALPACPPDRTEEPRRIESAESKARTQKIIDDLSKHFSVKAPGAPAAAAETGADAADGPPERQTVTQESD
ncbi:MAG: hypothetical protein EPN36_14325 [Rhodanobacteraceae bacterium]|nr:MAG: hypothetical protein EPN36_14325 [Rhodanobacteraceae bacterium]